MLNIIAITGATGQVGGRVARRLQSSAGLRLIVRAEPKRSQAPQVAGATVVAAEYRDGAAMRRALDGVGTLLLVSGRESADRLSEHRSAVDAAVAAGVGRIVYLSFVGAAPDTAFTFGRDHWFTEEHIRASGIGYTFLRDNFYLSYLPLFAGEDGVIRAPAGNGRVAAVAHDDVADVAARVLAEGGYERQILELTGPEALTLAEAAAQLTEVTGREVRYEPETIEEAYASRAHYGAAQFELDGWVTSYVAIARVLAANPGSYAHLLPVAQ
jgi:NAD(P)H dehydrogenase (quinone)